MLYTAVQFRPSPPYFENKEEELRKEYIVVLGGTGFNADSCRLRAATLIAIRNPRATLITCGMGQQNGQYEHEFLARAAMLNGISTKDILRVKSDPDNRSHQDEIEHVMRSLPWERLAEPPAVIFLTEGYLHALRVKRYALLQKPPLRSIEVVCEDDGEPMTWGRRLREIRSLFKFFKWRLTRQKH